MGALLAGGGGGEGEGAGGGGEDEPHQPPSACAPGSYMAGWLSVVSPMLGVAVPAGLGAAVRIDE
jgi:hypothetical protein